MSNADNRSVTLRGQNKILEPSDIQIHQHEKLKYYHLDFQGKRWERHTLTELCQDFMKHLIENYQPPAEVVKENG